MTLTIPDKFTAVMWDRLIDTQGTPIGSGIQLELEFDGRLDEERLARAVELSLDAEPILGCRFVTRWWRPFWKRLEGPARQAFFSTASKDEYEGFKVQPLDHYQGPQIKSCLLHGENGDRLLLKVSHVAADVGGVKDVVALVSTIYSRLADEPGYRPTPNVDGSRTFGQVLRRLPLRAFPQMYVNQWLDTIKGLRNPVIHKLPLTPGREEPIVYVRRMVYPDRLERLVEYGRERDATINDLVMAACLRALAFKWDWDGKSQLMLVVTVDLRRYLPSGRTGAICNQSGGEYFTLGLDPGDDFSSAVERISAATRKRKDNWIGLNDLVYTMPLIMGLPMGIVKYLLPKFFHLALERRTHPDVLTNAGILDPDIVAFGAQPVDAWILPPVNDPPMFLICVSSYQGTMTISAGTYQAQKDVIGRFLDSILEQLPYAG